MKLVVINPISNFAFETYQIHEENSLMWISALTQETKDPDIVYGSELYDQEDCKDLEIKVLSIKKKIAKIMLLGDLLLLPPCLALKRLYPFGRASQVVNVIKFPLQSDEDHQEVTRDIYQQDLQDWRAKITVNSRAIEEVLKKKQEWSKLAKKRLDIISLLRRPQANHIKKFAEFNLCVETQKEKLLTPLQAELDSCLENVSKVFTFFHNSVRISSPAAASALLKANTGFKFKYFFIISPSTLEAEFFVLKRNAATVKMQKVDHCLPNAHNAWHSPQISLVRGKSYEQVIYEIKQYKKAKGLISQAHQLLKLDEMSGFLPLSVSDSTKIVSISMRVLEIQSKLTKILRFQMHFSDMLFQRQTLALCVDYWKTDYKEDMQKYNNDLAVAIDALEMICYTHFKESLRAVKMRYLTLKHLDPINLLALWQDLK